VKPYVSLFLGHFLSTANRCWGPDLTYDQLFTLRHSKVFVGGLMGAMSMVMYCTFVVYFNDTDVAYFF